MVHHLAPLPRTSQVTQVIKVDMVTTLVDIQEQEEGTTVHRKVATSNRHRNRTRVRILVPDLIFDIIN
jgi:hypothetical protein